jgi:hypothetical protein
MRSWLLLVAVACGGEGSTEPARALTGTYVYSFALPAMPGVTAARSYSGTLHVTYATADSIGCTWSVSGYEAPCILGFRVAGSDNYLVYARRLEGATVNHSLRATAGSLLCNSGTILFQGSGQIVSVQGACELHRQ